MKKINVRPSGPQQFIACRCPLTSNRSPLTAPRQPLTRWFPYFNVTLIILSGILFTCGCAGLSEGMKQLAGVSTKTLEEERPHAVIHDVEYDLSTSYTKAQEILTKKGAYIYAKDSAQPMLAVYLSSTETTPVGIFFTRAENNVTRLEISSPSTYAKEIIAKKLSSGFDELSGKTTEQPSQAPVQAQHEPALQNQTQQESLPQNQTQTQP